MNKNVIYGLLTCIALLVLKWSMVHTNSRLEAIYGHPCLLGVTTQAYDLLEPGMSEEQIDAIIGRPGQELPGSGDLRTKVWQEGPKAIYVEFHNRHVESKKQVGL
jgi:hypothetical protein